MREDPSLARGAQPNAEVLLCFFPLFSCGVRDPEQRYRTHPKKVDDLHLSPPGDETGGMDRNMGTGRWRKQALCEKVLLHTYIHGCC